ncbi:hypothetical protein ICN19_08250, partial [Polynucleobacter sp. AP-Capit-er-40B-B4]|uniref:beta strand repeat-containing protein n=1 Tax=Polynucleobacter sp. AP-Capit-er-40B-B4 TaxID=2576927 RepID=UPI001C0DFC85
VTGNVTGVFANANVGNGLAVTTNVSGLTLSNPNYYVAGVTTALTANITPAPVTITGLSAANKVYDATTTATINGILNIAGLLSTDASTVTGNVTGVFANANVGNGLAVTTNVSGLTLSNPNYYVAGVTTALTANITAAPLTIAVNNDSKIYGSTSTNANISYTNGSTTGASGYTVSGLQGSDAISSVVLTSQGALATAGVLGSPYAINASLAVGTNNLSNYVVTYIPGALVVTPKTLAVTVDSKSMNYGDALMPTLTYSVAGLVNGDTSTISLATTASAYTGAAGSASNVGSYPITATASSNRNYLVSSSDGVLTVNTVALTIQANTQSTTYGSPLVLSQSALTATGLLNGDSVSGASILTDVAQTGQAGVNSQTVSGLTNAGTYSRNLSISNATGVRLSNYAISYQAGNLIVDKAVLTVTSVNDAKFIGQTDAAGYANSCGTATACAGGYAGVMYSGFKNADSVSSLNASGLVVARQNVSNVNSNLSGEPHAPDTYLGALQASGLTAANYSFNYVPGNYTIVPASQLLIKVGAVNTIYGTAPNYSNITAQYLYGNNIAPTTLSVSNIGATVSVSDGSGGTAQFNLIPVSPQFSGSNNLSVGSYGLQINTAPGQLLVSGTHFGNQLVISGGLTVTPLALTFNQLNISGLNKVYDGSAYMTNLSVNAAANAFIAGDNLSVLATGTFASKNVQNNLAYTVGVLFDGPDAANYVVGNGSSYAGTNGSITQLNSVTYTGSNTGGAWSNPANWTTTGTTAVGAIPDLANVANVIIPVGSTVVYDGTVAGPVDTNVANSGNLQINLSSAASMPMNISGTGVVTISGAGAVTLTGNSSYTGSNILNAGATLIAGSNNAIGTGNIQSHDGSFGTLTGVTLPAINATGSMTLLSSIDSTGVQSYGNLTLATTASGLNTSSFGATTISLASQNANISLLGTVDGVTAKTQSLSVNAGTGVVTIGDSVSSVTRLNSLDVTGATIYILADVLTSATQAYRGSVLIGDASYLNKPRVVGFLLAGYRGYFDYQRGGLVSRVDYLNSNPVYIRTLISEDPSVTFTGTVNDVVPNTHTLLVAAIAPSLASALIDSPAIMYEQAVGSIAPLYSLNSQTTISQSVVPATSSDAYAGAIQSTNVSTYSSQTYSTQSMTASASTVGGTVTFSIWDPTAAVNFMLPTHVTNGVTQLNLFNGNSAFLAINGSTNYSGAANTGVSSNQWAEPILNQALGYVAPPPEAPVNMAPTQVAPIPGDGAVLQGVLGNHISNMTSTLLAGAGSVSVSSPDEVTLVEGKSKSGQAKSEGGCSSDLDGNESSCAED